MLATVPPLAVVYATVGPCELSEALLLIINVVALIFATVLPGEHTVAVHFVLEPVAHIGTVVSPPVGPIALDLVVDKFALIVRFICPLEVARAMLEASLEITFIEGAVDPGLLAFSPLLI